MEIPEGGFNSIDELKVWLDGFDYDSATVFSRIIKARVPLKVLPHVADFIFQEDNNGKSRFPILLEVISSNLVTRVHDHVFVHNNEMQLNKAATVIFSTMFAAGLKNRHPAKDTAAFYAIKSAKFAAARPVGQKTTRSTAGAHVHSKEESDAENAISSLVRSLEFAVSIQSGATSIWAAVTADARALEAGATPEEMAARPLWPENSPYKPQFDRKTFLAAAPSFEVWLDWYEPIVDGNAPWGLPRNFANKLEERIALGDGRGEGGKDFWERDADVVNAEIKGWVAEARAEVALTSWPVDAFEDEQAFSQRPAPHQFDEVDGRIIATPMRSKRQTDDLSNDMWEELNAKTQSTRERLERTQSPRHIIEAFDRLIASLGDSFSDVRPGKLLMQCNTIEAINATYNTAEMRGEMAADCLTLVQDLSESLIDFKALFPELLDIETTRLAQKIAGASTNAILVETRKIAVFAVESDAVDESVLIAFDAAFSEIEEQERLAFDGRNDLAIAEANKKKAETTALHVLDVRNFAARVLKSRIVVGTAKIAKTVTKDVSKSAYKGALSAVEDTAKAGTKVGLTYLIAQFTGVLPAIAVYVLSFAPLAKKAAEIEADDPGKIGPQ